MRQNYLAPANPYKDVVGDEWVSYVNEAYPVPTISFIITILMDIINLVA